jgi:hypothetical protein
MRSGEVQGALAPRAYPCLTGRGRRPCQAGTGDGSDNRNPCEARAGAVDDRRLVRRNFSGVNQKFPCGVGAEWISLTSGVIAPGSVTGP